MTKAELEAFVGSVRMQQMVALISQASELADLTAHPEIKYQIMQDEDEDAPLVVRQHELVHDVVTLLAVTAIEACRGPLLELLTGAEPRFQYLFWGEEKKPGRDSPEKEIFEGIYPEKVDEIVRSIAKVIADATIK
jgi:hypothetical protein